MRNIFFEILILAFFIISCKEEIQIKQKIDSELIRKSIIYYLDSSKQSLQNISSLFSNINEPSNNYNKLTVDSLIINNRLHFAILLEHPIPVYNLFAVLDDSLNLVLRDKSLNGYLKLTKFNAGNSDYIQLTENYKSLDVFNLNRLSLYRKLGDKFYLVFRGHIIFTSPTDSVVRNITSLTDSVIICSIPKTKSLVKNEITYRMIFDNASKIFRTQRDFMDSLIQREINNFASDFSPNQILNKKSFLDLIKQNLADSLIEEKNEYEFTVPADWISLDNISFYKVLKKKVKGSYFVNKNLGVNIGIIKIPEFENSEDYVNANFTIQKKLRNYQIRESIVQEDVKYFSQAIEHQCNGIKYLLIIEGSKNVYRKNQDYFRDILSSFAISCE
jgi:hypothetical protein